MPVERRGQVTRVDVGQLATGGTHRIGGRRTPSLGGTSRISREAYVRICEGLGVRFPGPTRLVLKQLAQDREYSGTPGGYEGYRQGPPSACCTLRRCRLAVQGSRCGGPMNAGIISDVAALLAFSALS